MSISKRVNVNGFEFTLINDFGGTRIAINPQDTSVSKGILQNDPQFLLALEKLVKDSDEIKSVLLAEEAFGTWIQIDYADRTAELLRLLNSEYASDGLKIKVRDEIENPRPYGEPPIIP